MRATMYVANLKLCFSLLDRPSSFSLLTLLSYWFVFSSCC
jgi:hypothetical protein